MGQILRKVKKGLGNLPNLMKGYNIYVDRDKLNLILYAFRKVARDAHSFADLGAVWRVNAAYSIFTIRNFKIERAVVVDTHFNPLTDKKLSRFENVIKIKGDFGNDEIIARIGKVDMVFFFDTLLHQVNPNWDEILFKYAKNTDCFLIFNQQWVASNETFRLTDLPLDEYKRVVPYGDERFLDYLYAHQNEIHPEHGKRWKDIHNIIQWAITDDALRAMMERSGFREVYFKNCAQFSYLNTFENHAFIFMKHQKV